MTQPPDPDPFSRQTSGADTAFTWIFDGALPAVIGALLGLVVASILALIDSFLWSVGIGLALVLLLAGLWEVWNRTAPFSLIERLTGLGNTEAEKRRRRAERRLARIAFLAGIGAALLVSLVVDPNSLLELLP